MRLLPHTQKACCCCCCCCSASNLCLTLCRPMNCSTPGCPPLSLRVCSTLCPLSQWYYLTSSYSVVPFSCSQSFPASGSFPTSQLFASGSQSIGASASTFNISPSSEYSGLFSFRIDWFELLAVQGALKSLSSMTIRKHQFFGPQPSLWSNSHILWLHARVKDSHLLVSSMRGNQNYFESQASRK